MSPSTIEWTEETWNPTVGCSKVSDGCTNCYAIDVAHRAMQPAHEGLTIKRSGERPDWNGTVRCLPERLETPLRWRKPRRVFVDSMSDLFHPDVPDRFIADVFVTMAQAQQHTYQILTKRPQRMASLLGDLSRWLGLLDDAMARWGDERVFAEFVGASRYPPSWWWLGTSIESDRYTWRADHLRATPAAVRFLSLEPLLGPLPSLDLTGIDWVIVGGESGPGARPMHPVWVRDIRDRCVDEGVSFFFKQWGEWAPGLSGPPWEPGTFTHRVERDGSVQPRPPHEEAMAEARRLVTGELVDSGWFGVTRVGKKAAGRELDGRTWDEMPS